MIKTESVIPIPVVRRLSRYRTYLQVLKQKNIRWVCSEQIANAFSLTSITVRRDITYLQNFSGIPKRGYKISELIKVLNQTLSNGNKNRVILVGTATLGYSSITHGSLKEYGFEICGVFDNNADAVGRRIDGFEVLPTILLSHFVWKEKITIGIIAVHEKEAQNIADLLIIAGIHGLVNFTSTKIVAPDNVQIIDIPLVSNLLELSCLISLKQ